MRLLLLLAVAVFWSSTAPFANDLCASNMRQVQDSLGKPTATISQPDNPGVAFWEYQTAGVAVRTVAFDWKCHASAGMPLLEYGAIHRANAVLRSDPEASPIVKGRLMRWYEMAGMHSDDNRGRRRQAAIVGRRIGSHTGGWDHGSSYEDE
jgi:hypothetical protein